jgi:hypothetical protein
MSNGINIRSMWVRTVRGLRFTHLFTRAERLRSGDRSFFYTTGALPASTYKVDSEGRQCGGLGDSSQDYVQVTMSEPTTIPPPRQRFVSRDICLVLSVHEFGLRHPAE